MNPSTLIGIVASVILLAVVLFYTAVDPSLFIYIPGLLVVLVVTMAATFISYPLSEVVRIFGDRKSTRLNSSHVVRSARRFCTLSLHVALPILVLCAYHESIYAYWHCCKCYFAGGCFILYRCRSQLIYRYPWSFGRTRRDDGCDIYQLSSKRGCADFWSYRHGTTQ